ncbi:hypothetical protein PN4B1_17100 [Paenibacillus naphthalenovorans]|uniref:hypothetical protein n=1 Tax=Paenibacillus naphthalenovorans TaxID=162209 RepID=UPI0010B2F10C|nr:hypothetical protein [Paenibacillus naphthalenovorans]GCL71805.1 hypothetical protein PN4B1_17100 [Paenibacillus naphthalenovorans]
MRKYLIGALVGAALALSFNVSAAVESLIGKSVQGEFVVKLNGNELPNKAAVVDGSSYLPVRAIGESLGLEVDFENNEVLLNEPKKEDTSQVTVQPVSPTESESPVTIESIEFKIRDVKSNIQTLTQIIDYNEKDIKFNPDRESSVRPWIDRDKATIERLQAELAELERQKAALQP